jgi:RNA polymerase sigma factor (sigma-70 family)
VARPAFVPARGLVEDVRDAHRNQPRPVAHTARPPAADGLDAAGEIADSLLRPDELAARIQTAGRLQQAVRALPLALRQVMVLAFEGLSNEDIAAVLGLTAGNVGVRLHRGKALLKAALGETT